MEPRLVVLDCLFKTLKIVDLYGAILFELALHYDPCSLAASNETIIIGSRVMTVKGFGIILFEQNQLNIFNKDANPVQTIRTTSYPSSISFNERGDKFACGLYTGQVQVFQMIDDTWVQTQHWSASKMKVTVHLLSWLGDGRICACTMHNHTSIWDIVSGEALHSLNDDKIVHCWDIAIPSNNYSRIFVAGSQLGVWQPDEDLLQFRETGSEAGVARIRVSDDNSTVFASLFGGIVIAFDIATLEELWRRLLGTDISSIECFEDEVFIALSQSHIVVLSVRTGESLREFTKAEWKNQLALLRG